GAIAWEMLTGRMAFSADMFSVALYKVCFVDPPDIHLARPDVPPAVSMVLRRALAKERAQRTGTVGEVAVELAAAAHGVMPATVPRPAPDGTESVPGLVTPPASMGSLAVAGTAPASAPRTPPVALVPTPEALAPAPPAMGTLPKPVAAGSVAQPA